MRPKKRSENLSPLKHFPVFYFNKHHKNTINEVISDVMKDLGIDINKSLRIEGERFSVYYSVYDEIDYDELYEHYAREYVIALEKALDINVAYQEIIYFTDGRSVVKASLVQDFFESRETLYAWVKEELMEKYGHKNFDAVYRKHFFLESYFHRLVRNHIIQTVAYKKGNE